MMKTIQIPNQLTTLFCFLYLLSRSALLAGATSGTVVGWGSNVSGNATGVPHLGFSTGVVVIADHVLTDVTSIAAGDSHSLALRSNGTVVGWGANGDGKATGSASTVYPYRAGAVVEIDGKLVSNAVAIAAARTYSLALNQGGTLAAWGSDLNGDQIRVPHSLSNVVSITGWYSLVVKSNGTVTSWGGGEETVISGLSNIVTISAPRADHGDLVALREDGVVLGIRLTSPPSSSIVMSNATAISAGRWQNLALKRDGSVFAWGKDNSLPGGLTNVVAISAGENHSLALRSDGTVVAWGPTPRLGLGVPVGLSNIVAIAAGNDFSLAITTNKAVAEQFMPKEE